MQGRGIVFKAFSQWYVVPLGKMQEVIQDLSIMELPWSSPWLLGVANVRNTVVPVTCFYQLVTGSHLPTKSRSDGIILFSEDEWLYGIFVPELVGLREYTIQPLTLTLREPIASISAAITGQTEIEGRNVLIFEPGKLLTIQKFMHPVQKIGAQAASLFH